MVVEKLNIVGAFANIMASGKIVMDWLTSEPFLMTLFCGSIVSLACYFIVKVKKASKA